MGALTGEGCRLLRTAEGALGLALVVVEVTVARRLACELGSTSVAHSLR